MTAAPQTRYVPPLCPGPGPDAWACRRCGTGWFGTPPDDGLCPGCRAGHR
jgi:rubrerythrin